MNRRTPGGGAGLELSEPETLEEPVAGRGPLGDPSLDFSVSPPGFLQDFQTDLLPVG